MTAARPATPHEPIAIVGIGCRFPGGVTDAASFWRILKNGVDAITEIPANRIDLTRWFDSRPATPGRTMTRWGGFLERIEDFDALAFGTSPREAERLDPQQRLLLETAWEALEDAGQDIAKLDGSRTGVFVGQWLSDFESRMFADAAGVDFFMTTGSGRYATSGRLSYTLGLRGPSLTIDTACSSSLVAVHLAVQSIRNGESDLALAGGVNVILQPQISIAYSQSLMMAPDGHCKFGDAAGDGYVRSEGAAVIVLKSLSRARADGDEIYALVRGSAVNNDGRSSGSLGTPSRDGQEDMLRTAYNDAGVSPGAVGYIEAHGTGTRVGDPIELGALGAVLVEGRAPGARCAVGSVKTNFGHTEGAAGIAGLIKAALSLRHGAIPPSLHLKERNPAVPWPTLPVEIPTALRDWPRTQGPRVAGVSAFGIAGTNAHVVLEEAPATVSAAAVEHAQSARPTSLLVLSAKSGDALRALAGRYAELLTADGAPTLRDVCWSAATRRTALEYRAAFVAPDGGAMATALRAHAAGDVGAVEGGAAPATRARIAFVCPGQGAQWVGMGRELAAREPVFRAMLERCDATARPYADWSIIEQLHCEPNSPAWRLDDIGVIQPVLVALAIAYAELWRSLGVVPDAVIGHSMGEVAAAFIAGVLDLDHAMQIICRRSALMRQASGKGAMLLAELSMADARKRIEGREALLSVAVNNSPRSSVISGDPTAVQAVMAELERDHVFCRLVKVDVASHSPQMQPLADALGAELAGLAPHSAGVPIYSTVTGQRGTGTDFGAEYWASNLRQPVQFESATRALLEDGVTIFVELGPHPVLLPSVEQTAQAVGRATVTVACGRRDEPEQTVMLEAIGRAWSGGAGLAWGKVMPEGGLAVKLPAYPWQRERHWVDAALIRSAAADVQGDAQVQPDAESLGLLYALRWRPIEPLAPPSAAAGTSWVVVSENPANGEPVAHALRDAGATAAVCAPSGVQGMLSAHSPAAASRIVLLLDGDADAPHRPLEILQAALRSSAPIRLWVVTRGAHSTDDSSPTRCAVDQSAAWGAGRVIAEEHPELWGGLIDLGPASFATDDAALLVAQLLDGSGERQVALRETRRLALRLVRAAQDGSVRAYAWRRDGAYLVTGGLGEIGLRVARTMVEQGARRIVLLGRTALPPRDAWNRAAPGSETERRIARVRELESLGASVQLAALDVGDESQLRGFLEQYASEAWPPIRGVIHAAGTFENRLASAMDAAAFDAVLTPKLRGAQLLDRLLPDVELFVLFSSTGAFLAQAGQANYAAGNAGLDALANDRRARGLPALSIEWGVWENTGLVRGAAGAQNVAEMARQGIRAFSPERGAAMFAWLCGSREATIAVLPIDWNTFRESRPDRDVALFRELDAEPSRSDSRDAGLRRQLADADGNGRRKLIEPVVREIVGRVLKIAPSRVDARKAFGSMGLTSLLAMEFRNRLESALGRSLSATLAFNYPTVDALVAHLASVEEPPQVARAATATAGADVPTNLGDVAKLSDDEAARRLRGGRRRAIP